MRLIKNTEINYPLLHESVQWINSSRNRNSTDSNLFDKSDDFSRNTKLLQLIYSLKWKLENSDSISDVLTHFQHTLKEILFLKEIQIFYFEENNQHLIPLNDVCDITYTNFINKAYSDGIVDWIFEKKQPTVLPGVKKSDINENQLNMLLVPIYSLQKPRGLFSVITTQNFFPPNSFEVESIKLLLGIVLPKIDLIHEKQKLNQVYNELQLYQSKLSNDFKLSAIGELTTGLVEDVINPTQVILSCIKLLESDYQNIDEQIFQKIYSQISKIETVVGRLNKFAAVNKNTSNIYPADLNLIIKDYYEIVLSTLKYKNYECILDLEAGIPPILTKSTYIHQLLTNFFSLMKNSQGGGIVIQTKFVVDKIVVNFITTDVFSPAKLDIDQKTNLKMMENIMHLHEGTIKIFNPKSSGSSFVLTFPLRRKIRK